MKIARFFTLAILVAILFYGQNNISAPIPSNRNIDTSRDSDIYKLSTEWGKFHDEKRGFSIQIPKHWIPHTPHSTYKWFNEMEGVIPPNEFGTKYTFSMNFLSTKNPNITNDTPLIEHYQRIHLEDQTTLEESGKKQGREYRRYKTEAFKTQDFLRECIAFYNTENLNAFCYNSRNVNHQKMINSIKFK